MKITYIVIALLIIGILVFCYMVEQNQKRMDQNLTEGSKVEAVKSELKKNADELISEKAIKLKNIADSNVYSAILPIQVKLDDRLVMLIQKLNENHDADAEKKIERYKTDAQKIIADGKKIFSDYENMMASYKLAQYKHDLLKTKYPEAIDIEKPDFNPVLPEIRNYTGSL